MKRFNFITVIEENGKLYAMAEALRAGENMMTYLSRYKGLKILHLCETATEAHITAEQWNEDYKRNGTLLFN